MINLINYDGLIQRAQRARRARDKKIESPMLSEQDRRLAILGSCREWTTVGSFITQCLRSSNLPSRAAA